MAIFLNTLSLSSPQIQKILHCLKRDLGKKAGILGNSISEMKAFYLFQKLWKEMINYDEYEH